MENKNCEYAYVGVSDWEIECRTLNVNGKSKFFKLDKLKSEDINFRDGEISVFLTSVVPVPELENIILQGNSVFIAHQFVEAKSTEDGSKIKIHYIYNNIKDLLLNEHSDCSSISTCDLSFETHQERERYFE